MIILTPSRHEPPQLHQSPVLTQLVLSRKENETEENFHELHHYPPISIYPQTISCLSCYFGGPASSPVKSRNLLSYFQFIHHLRSIHWPVLFCQEQRSHSLHNQRTRFLRPPPPLLRTRGPLGALLPAFRVIAGTTHWQLPYSFAMQAHLLLPSLRFQRGAVNHWTNSALCGDFLTSPIWHLRSCPARPSNQFVTRLWSDW